MPRVSFQAQCYAAGSAYAESVEVNVTAEGQLCFRFQDVEQRWWLSDCTISDRIGNTPRYLDHSSGQRLESKDNDALDALAKQQNPKSGLFRAVHWLEQRLLYALLAVPVVLAVVISAYVWGIPAMAKVASPAVPDDVRELVSRETLALMDRSMLGETELFSWQQQHYQSLLDERLRPFIDHPLTLDFRHSESMGANAFALPDGTIVFTDQIMALLSDDEFLAIAAHEAGHVAHDHGMRSVLSVGALSVSIALMTGDSSALSEVLITAPTLLMQMAYSRTLETEADDHAYELMTTAAIPHEAFATAMEKIVSSYELEADEDDEWLNYLSTHPAPKDRIERFRSSASEKD